MADIIGGKDTFSFHAWDTVVHELQDARDTIGDSPADTDTIRRYQQIMKALNLLQVIWGESK